MIRIEEEVRRYWRRHQVAAAFRAAHRDGPPYLVCQQPLAAASQSWADQIRLWATADLLARYQAMRGRDVRHQTGWSCHGLPVEIAVEQALGPDLADYDLAQFNAACHETAVSGVTQGQDLAEWLGVWPDPDAALVTLSPQSVGAVWGALKKLWAAGRLKKERRVVPFCPRCATPLSTTEAARRAVTTEGRWVWVRLPWDGQPDTYLLVWTPAPWTLVSMVALAVHPEATYVLVERHSRGRVPPTRLLLAEAALNRTTGGAPTILRRLPGKALRGTRYHPPFTFVPASGGSGQILVSPEVPLERGTGLLPVTPTFDSLSLSLAQAHGLPVPDVLDDFGSLDDAVTPWRGLSPLDAEPLLVEDLQSRGLLLRQETREQQRALCPYCDTLLLSLARPVWLIETGSGPWIVGRDRAWGAPLPVWVCEGCGHADCLAGLDDLAHRTGLDAGQIDPHRPVIDQLTFPCARCGATMRRVAAVIDPAFEEALLPRTTLSQPGAAHLAVGLGDRELGWLGDLAEMAALLEGTLAWEQALALPEDETGTLGEPESVPPADALHWAAYVGRAPADTVRWAAYAGTTPGDAERDVLRPLWRIATDLPGLSPGEEDSGGDAAGTLLERWALACLHQATIAVSEALDATHPGRAVGEVAGLANDLAYWHQVRHLGSGSEGQKVLSCLLAPFAPHLAEAMYRAIGDGAPTSVHLAAWPVPDPAWQDRALLSQVALVRRAAALGQSARQLAGIPAGQPLRQALVASLAPAGPEGDLPIPLLDLLAEMLGAGQARFAGEATEHVVWHLALEPGQAVERDIPRQEIETALANLTPEQAAELAAQLRRGLSISLDAATQAITILPDEVVITAQGRPGWAAAADPGLLVVLHAALDVG